MQQIDIFLLNCCCLKLVLFASELVCGRNVRGHCSTFHDIGGHMNQFMATATAIALVYFDQEIFQQYTTMYNVYFKWSVFPIYLFHSIPFRFILFGFIRFFIVFPTVFYILLNCPSAINSAIFISIIIVLFLANKPFILCC